MDRYMEVLRWSLRHRWKTLGIGGLALAATVLAYGTLPMTFRPAADFDYSQVHIELAPGATLAQTEATADRVSRLLTAEQEVKSAFADVNVGVADIYITLRDDRKRSSVEFERALQVKLAAIPDARIHFQSQEEGSGRDITIMLAGDDPARLNSAALELVRQMQGVKEIRSPRIEGDMRRPEITIRPRFDLAADLGVTTAALSQSIRIATIGDIDQNVAKFSLSDRQIPIRVSIDEAARENLATIENLPVPTVNGGSVPLKVVADIGFGSGPTEIRRYAQKRRVMISADLAPGLVSGDAMAKINDLSALKNLPSGVERVTIGSSKWQAELIRNFIIAVISGVMLVFAVLVLLYRRVLPPLVNMGSLLLAPLGGAVALHLTGNVLSMPVLIGVLMLLGIVAKNSILLIDFSIEEINRGVEKTAAIIDAGHKRAQPIAMTTVAMVAGMLPTALALTGDSAMRSPMGWTVIGGLILSTLLTLVIVPAGFSLADDCEKWLAPRLGKLLTHRPQPRPAPLPAE